MTKKKKHTQNGANDDTVSCFKESQGKKTRTGIGRCEGRNELSEIKIFYRVLNQHDIARVVKKYERWNIAFGGVGGEEYNGKGHHHVQVRDDRGVGSQLSMFQEGEEHKKKEVFGNVDKGDCCNGKQARRIEWKTNDHTVVISKKDVKNRVTTAIIKARHKKRAQNNTSELPLLGTTKIETNKTDCSLILAGCSCVAKRE